MKAVYIGSFDPVTNGHLDIIKRAVKMFSHVYVAIGVNPDKTGLFDVALRLKMIKNALRDVDSSKFTVESFTGLAVDYMYSRGARITIRGIRNNADLEYENNMNLINKDIMDIETVYLPCDPKFATVSSSAVKMLVKSYVNVSKMVPAEVKFHLEAKLLNVILIGVIGKSGSGKSTFISKLYANTIDYDKLVRKIWDDDKYIDIRINILNTLKQYEPKLLTDRTMLNKVAMREFISVESNNAKVRELMQPAIDVLYRAELIHVIKHATPSMLTGLREFNSLFDEYPNANVILLDAPMLIEYNHLDLVNYNVINIDTPYEICRDRIMKRDGISATQAEKRLDSQLSTEKIDYIVGYNQSKEGFGIYAKYTESK